MKSIDQPDLIDAIWNGQWFWLLPDQAFPGLDAQVEF
jgi:hypothetical protein